MSGAGATGKSAAPPRLLGEYLAVTTEFLEGKGVESPRIDAELMLATALGMTRVDLYTNHERPLVADEVERYRDMVKRRAGREPVHYIVGSREFWSLDFRVDRRVLIPRPETELLVELAVEFLKARDPGARLLDLGTGSGAIAVSVASEITDLQVLATDTSASVLELAPMNAQAHSVADRIEFCRGDLFAAVADDVEPFDLLLSNPPYVTSEEYSGLQPEVRQWEPMTALVGGDDGMSVVGRLVDEAPAYLKSDGQLMVEVGSQWRQVVERFEAGGWRDVQLKRDLAGRERVVTGLRPD